MISRFATDSYLRLNFVHPLLFLFQIIIIILNITIYVYIWE